jgi:rubredoxin
MDKWRCIPCDYVYDPAEGDPDSEISPDTPFEDLPEDWECPECGVGKDG